MSLFQGVDKCPEPESENFMYAEKQWQYKNAPVSSIDVRVLDSEINPYRQMHLDRIFQYMQEVASVNLRELQKEYRDIREEGYAWIVNSISIRLKRLPGMGEIITYSSYPGPQNSLFMDREYSFAIGREWLGGASALWFIADAETHRPMRLETVGRGITGRYIDQLAMGQGARRFRGSYVMPKSLLSYRKRAEFSDLDLNGHMSNTRYIAWCMDAVQAAGLSDRPVLALDINFLSELYGGDLVEVHLTPKSMLSAEQRLAWLGVKKAEGEAEADLYVHAAKADGSLCFKAQLFFDDLLKGEAGAEFLKQV